MFLKSFSPSETSHFVSAMNCHELRIKNPGLYIVQLLFIVLYVFHLAEIVKRDNEEFLVTVSEKHCLIFQQNNVNPCEICNN